MPESHAGKHKVYPSAKLGEYHIIRDIAEGTFGKVRSASGLQNVHHGNCMTNCVIVSGSAYCDGTQSRYEVYLEAGHSCDEDQDASATRGGVHEGSQTSAHYQAVSLVYPPAVSGRLNGV
jgi:hypothetical protein